MIRVLTVVTRKCRENGTGREGAGMDGIRNGNGQEGNERE